MLLFVPILLSSCTTT